MDNHPTHPFISLVRGAGAPPARRPSTGVEPARQPWAGVDPAGRLWPGVCLGGRVLSPEERHHLDAYPDAAGPPPLAVHCILSTGHPGRHLSVGVRSRRREAARWLRWTPGPAGDHNNWRAYDAPTCDRISRHHEVAPGEPDWCRLPQGHPGPHSFTYFPDLVWPFREMYLSADYPHP